MCLLPSAPASVAVLDVSLKGSSWNSVPARASSAATAPHLLQRLQSAQFIGLLQAANAANAPASVGYRRPPVVLQLQRLLQCLLFSSVTTASASAAVLAESSSSYPCRWNNSCRNLLQTCYRACGPSGLLLLQHLLQCIPSLPESSSSYLCSWKSSCLDLSLTSSAAIAIADTLYCFSSSICYSVCRSLVLLLLLLRQ